MGYQSWKIAQLKAAAMEGSGSAYDEEILMKNWNVDKMRAATILRVMIKSKAAGMLRVGVMLTVVDNENKNVNFPLTEVKENLFSNDSKQAFVFLKIDPSKNTWGDLDCEVNVKYGKTSQISTGGYTSTTYNASSYSTTGAVGGGYYGMSRSVSDSVSTSTSYKPIVEEGSTKINCVNCSAECFVGEDYCGKCG